VSLEDRGKENIMDTTLHRRMVLWAMGMALAIGLVVALAALPASAAPRSVDPDTLTPPPPPGAECQDTGNYIICHTFGDESWANQPDYLLSCGRAYSTGSSHSEGIRWYSSEGLLLKRFVRVTGSGTWSLSPTGEEPTVRFFGHYNYVDYLAIPGDFDSATTIEHGLDSRWWRPGSGVMLRLAGIFVFSPEGVTHHGAGEFALDDEGNLVIPEKADAALCEALQL
jgi:hypothetical protein